MGLIEEHFLLDAELFDRIQERENQKIAHFGCIEIKNNVELVCIAFDENTTPSSCRAYGCRCAIFMMEICPRLRLNEATENIYLKIEREGGLDDDVLLEALTGEREDPE